MDTKVAYKMCVWASTRQAYATVQNSHKEVCRSSVCIPLVHTILWRISGALLCHVFHIVTLTQMIICTHNVFTYDSDQ